MFRASFTIQMHHRFRAYLVLAKIRGEDPKTKAPEVLTTPGASLLVAGGRYDTVCDLPLPLPVVGLIGARAP
jgi:hypothetical protein